MCMMMLETISGMVFVLRAVDYMHATLALPAVVCSNCVHEKLALLAALHHYVTVAS